LHAQVKLPDVFVHVALASQVLVPVVHSSSSVQVVPSPVKPGLHVHVELPLGQAAFAPQGGQLGFAPPPDPGSPPEPDWPPAPACGLPPAPPVLA